ncbi:glycosyltransferase family 4 protein [Paucidesulfovibrio gracilis]|uniref:glycosyltransferase family 4 protein n=1 Tax=Paucidesulfovibrio gracilis TaxID=47158 RepID=UPI002E10A40D
MTIISGVKIVAALWQGNTSRVKMRTPARGFDKTMQNGFIPEMNKAPEHSGKKRVWGTLDPFWEFGAVLGRKMANSSFLTALLRADPFDEYHFFPAGQDQRRELRTRLQEAFPPLGKKIHVLDRQTLPDHLARTPYHCFHQSDCIVHQAHLARARNAFSPEIFPITGVTHSLSYANYGEAFLRHLWPGVCPRDAIVSTSRPGLEAVRTLLEHLHQGYGLGSHMARPTLRRIPLGVDADAFPEPADQMRAQCRQTLQLPEQATVYLVFGRISHHSKMDLLPLLRAFQHAFQDASQPENTRLRPHNAVLLLAGWVEDDDPYPQTLRELAANIGLDLRVEARPGERRKARLYQAADVFVSIADNPQETFGLTVLEAAAAGLPAVASDYDGYRDLVLPEQTGLLVPTLGPARTTELDVMAPLLFDNQYHLLLAQRTAVSIPELAQSLTRLHARPELRRAMGRRARERVLGSLTWDHTVRAYLDLWKELWTLPAEPAETHRNTPHPAQMPYALAFAGYASQQLHPEDTFSIGRTGNAIYRRQDAPLVYPGLDTLAHEESIRRLLFLARKPATTAELTRQLLEADVCPNEETAQALLLWALKHDLLTWETTRLRHR